MFPTFISILDIQSWWEVPSIAHFCSLFRTAFNLLDFDIEDLEEALLTDGTEESSWLQELIVRLLSGCLPNNEISTFNYQMFLRRLFRQKCQEHDRYNPFNTDCDFTLLPLRTKVDILHALCDFRLDAEDVLDQLKNLEADSLRVEPLGYDSNDSAYWYFYGTRLYREDFQKKNNKKKSIWQVICFTEDDWFQLTKKFKNSTLKPERALYHTLSKNFLPELPRLFKEKERQARRRLLENQPRRTSDRIRKLDIDIVEGQESEAIRPLEGEQESEESEESKKKKEQEIRRKDSFERRSKLREDSEASQSEPEEEERHEMAAKKKGRGRQRKQSSESSDNNKEITPTKRKKTRSSVDEESSKHSKTATVGRQTNNSLSAADGQIVIKPAVPATTTKKKLKTSQVFQQTDEDLQVGMHKIIDFVKNHEDAWPFLDPVEEEYAPNYYSIIRRPMDLTRMEDRLDQGTYKTFEKFKGDFQLIVNNCRLYNGVENEYTEMVDNLLKVFEKATVRFLDQISSSDEEIAVENLNTDSDSKDMKNLKHSKKKKHSESPARTSSRGRKPALVAQGKKRARSPSEESEENVSEEEVVVEKKSKKPEKELKKAKKEIKESKKIEKDTKENKRNEKDTKENKRIEKDFKENKRNEKDSKESKKSEKENKKLVKETAEKKKNDKEVKENRKTEKDVKNHKKGDKEVKELKENEKDVKVNKKASKDKKESKKSEKDKHDSKREEKEAKKSEKESKKSDEEDKKSKKHGKNSKSKNDKLEIKKEKRGKEKENKIKDKGKKPKKRGRKKKRVSPARSRSKSFSTRSPSPSPARSMLSTPPPSSPDSVVLKKETKKSKAGAPTGTRGDDLNKAPFPWEESLFGEDPPPPFSPKRQNDGDQSAYSSSLQFAFKPAKDKHNKLRETIEKLKAKSEISKLQTPVYDFESDDHLKENKDKNKKAEKEEKGKHKPKEKAVNNKSKKPHEDAVVEDGNGSQTDVPKKPTNKKKEAHQQQPTKQVQEAVVTPTLPPVLPKPPAKQSNFDALSLATGQTLKDIIKWLDDTPKFDDFSSASNSPSYLALDDFDLLGTTKPEPKKVEQVASPLSTPTVPLAPGLKKDTAVQVAPVTKENKKKPFRDPSKFFNKRREIQRTIDRLQPGKGKGNLITSVQSTTKPDELFPLGPLSKIKDTKNSLIVKTDLNAPKLSLGSVLDSFGKHKFVDDPVTKEEEEEEKKEKEKVQVPEKDKEEPAKTAEPAVKPEEGKEEKKVAEDGGAKVEKGADVKEPKPAEEPSAGGPTPNLSAWFKAFGAPKAPPPQKKPESTKSESKEEESTAKSERVPVPDPSPSLDSPQPVARQRRISTGSSMSERSSFSQDLDSPRVGMDERGAYPAPYPSPLHRSPSGASPVMMASPRPDISPRSAAYPFNGQMRVGFYQDTVSPSNKSSPDKSASCSPHSSSPFYAAAPGVGVDPHVYAPNTTQNAVYSYASGAAPPYYTHAPPNYSSTNPTPPYNMDGSSSSYYDTSKVGAVEQYQAKPSQNYTANSPASSQASPAPQPQLSPHSPIVHSQTSPSLHSQQSSVHSPSMHSPSMHSPSVHSPSMHSPSMHSPSVVNSPQLHSPNPGLHSPGLSVHSPQMSVVSPQMSVVSPQMSVVSPQMSVVSPQMSVVSPQMSVVSPQMSVVSPQVNSPGLHSPIGVVNSPHHSQVHSPNVVEQFHSAQQEDASNSSGGDVKGQSNIAPNQPVFPVKKRAFVDSDLSQFTALQEELANRSMQMTAQQLAAHNPSATKPETAIKQPTPSQQEQMLQQQMQKQVQEQLLQQAQQLQQQKNQQQLMQQQAHLQKQAQLQQQQKNQQQQAQKNQQQLLQQQQAALSMYAKSSEGSLRTPSPPLQHQSQQSSMSQQQQALSQQQQQGQRGQQQVPAHSNSESTASSLRNMSYPTVTSQSNPYNSNYSNREAFSLNIPSARSVQQHQQKLDMSKFTNMGYTGPEVNFSRALQQQYGRPELSYTRTTVQSAISQASQLLSSQAALTSSQTSASSASSLPGYQKQTTNQQQAHSGNYQSNRSVDSVAERLAAQAQQEAAANYKPDMASSRSNYNSSTIDLEQALGLSRNISNLPNIYSNEQQRMMAGLQSSSNPYYTDKGLGTSHMFNKTMSSAAAAQQIFSQANMAAMSSYTQSMQQQQQSSGAAAAAAASMYNRQMNDLQAAQVATQAQSHADLKAATQSQTVAQERKNSRKKKSSSKSAVDASQVNSAQTAQAAPSASSGPAQGFQSYAGLKGPASSAAPTIAGSALDSGAISLKTASVVPGSAFNFGPAASGALGLSSGLYGDKDSYSNFLDDFRSAAPNFYMAAAAAHHRSTPEGGASGKGGQSSGATSSQSYPSFLNPPHQTRTSAYPLGGPFIPPSAQAQLMDTSSQLYQHYLQAGVLNQGLLGAPGAYPPGYHPALAMRQPYDSMSRPSWL